LARDARTLAAVLALAITAACSAPPPSDDPADYVRDIAASRAEKDAAFRNASDSPIPGPRRAELLPLEYFAPNPDYSVPAALTPVGPREIIQMPTSTGQTRSMERVGRLSFTLKGQTMTLGAFIESGSTSVDRLFVPFMDRTSGSSTYAAGRYLDLDRTATGLYLVDFNRAYNPYCYYNPTYDCPFPPAENRLAVAIEAGERVKGRS
jgi:uncharacterized protein (DUF1684 family)